MLLPRDNYLALLQPLGGNLVIVAVYVAFGYKRINEWSALKIGKEPANHLTHYMRYFIGGIMLPGLIQYVYLVLGAFIFEYLELEAEENANADFTRCLTNFTRTECRQWEPNITDAGKAGTVDLATMHSVIGEPSDYPWRNFDLPGGIFFCFTLTTTIGYGTFSPQTAGGRLFACIYLLLGIPLNAKLYGNIGNAVCSLLFHAPGCLMDKYESYMRSQLGTAADADEDQSGTVSTTEVSTMLAKAKIKMTEVQVDAFIVREGFDPAVGVPTDKYETLISMVVDYDKKKLETMLMVGVLVISLLAWSVFLPISDPASFPFGFIDGLYFSLVTFTTVGLGDMTISFLTAHSLHGNFEYWAFVALSLELGLVASALTSAVELFIEMREFFPNARFVKTVAQKVKATATKMTVRVKGLVKDKSSPTEEPKAGETKTDEVNVTMNVTK